MAPDRFAWTTALGAVLLAATAGCEPAYRAGVATVVITPEEPMWAAGYGSRTGPVSEALHDLHAKAMVVEDAAGVRLVIVTTDLLGLPRTLAEPVAEAVEERFGIPRHQLMLTSSHTHCGPVLRDMLVDVYDMNDRDWEVVERYSRALERKLVTVVGEALDDMRPAELAWGVGEAGFAVNRRENRERDVGQPGYVPVGPVDHDVPVLRVHDPDGQVRAVLFGYACHCTTLSFDKWCGDYAGFAQIDIESAHPGATALFMAGCGGDINPLPRRSVELCMAYGRELAEAVGDVLSGDMTPIRGPLASAWARRELPFGPLPDREELERQRRHGNRYEQRRAARLLRQLDDGVPLPETYAYPIQVFQFGDELTLVALAGEVVVDYALRLKEILGAERTWVAAYANDVFAYIPSRRVLHEGGYEGASSMAVYGLPTTWSPAIEDMILRTVVMLTNFVRRDQDAPEPSPILTVPTIEVEVLSDD